MFILALMYILLGLCLFQLYVHLRKTGRLINHIGGPPILPFFGNLLSFQLSPEELWNLLRKMNDDYYPIYRIWSFMTPVVNIRHPDDVEIVLSSTKHVEKSIIYKFLHPWFGTGLLTSAGQKWMKRRKILTPAFHFNILQYFVDIFIEEAERMAASLKVNGKPVIKELLSFTSEHTLNAICETAMGTSLQGRGPFQFKYRRAIKEMGWILLYRLVRPWIHTDFAFSLTPVGRNQARLLKILHGFTRKIITERKIYHDATEGQFLKGLDKNNGVSRDGEDDLFGIRKKRLAMLDLLIAASRDGNQIDDNGIREEVDTFMFEGHDTSGMGLCFIMMLLAEHKEIQNHCRVEVNAVLEEYGKLNMTALQHLPYLERCIKESLRLYPSVPFISRNISSDLQLKNGFVPAGTILHVHIYDIHRDPNFWPNADVFDPDRFLPENIQGRHPYSYVPFSAGSRNCIGQRFALLELKTLVGYILHNFYLEPVDLLKDVRMITDLVLRPAHPIRIKFIPIN